jgi:iron complex outermembrane receptor protein
MNREQSVKTIFFLFAFSIPFCFAYAQNKIVTGRVTEKKEGLPLGNVSVVVKGTQIGTLTDSAGNFLLNVPSPTLTLRISAVGFLPLEMKIPVENGFEVQLTADITTMNEVVVIGYGTARKKDLTGAIGSVKEEDFNKGIFKSPDQLVQGKVSGLQITSNNGQPGGAAIIKIRGNSALTGTGQPLYVIDGVPLDGRSLQEGNNPLNFINPDDILSIDVLKDASATAIYGSRASFGVMIINTKKGKAGEPRLNVGISTGISSILKKIEVLNADEFRDAIKYYDVSPNNDKGGDVDALDAILQNGFQQNYSIAVNGGNENGRYRVSANLLDQEGILKNTGFKKYGIDLSTNFKFLESKKLGLDINLFSNQYIQDVPFPGRGASDLIASALSWNPTDSLTNADGSMKIQSGNIITPVALNELVSNQLKVSTILASISPYFKITSWLEYKFLYSINYSTSTSRNSVNQLLPLTNFVGSAGIGSNELITQQFSHTLNFNKEILPGLQLNALAGFEFMRFDMKGFTLSGFGVGGTGFGNFGLDYTNYIQYSDLSRRSVSSFADPFTELQSYFGRTMFNYKDKYHLTATIRADGSTKFGENNKYGYFPSFAAAWIISNEQFFKTKFINTLKIRAGWGITGNQEFPSGSSQIKYSFRDGGNIIQVNSPNPDLKWQSDKQLNIGFDFSIFNNRVSGTVDYYNKATTNLLFPSPPIQPAPPLSVVRWINLDGKIINKGLEVMINGTVIKNENFKWDLSVNASFMKNNVSGMPSTISTGFLQGSGVSGASVQVIANDLPMNAFFTRKFLGMDKASGFALYEDDGNTFYYVGNPNPKTLAGLSSTLRYKKWTFTVNMYGAFGQDIFYNTLLNEINVGGIRGGGNIGLSVFQDPVKESLANPVTPSSRFIFKGNYFKGTNLSLNYSLGDASKFFKEANIYITGQNLFILTKYPGFDPESDFNGSNNGVPSLGIDYVQYPSSRTIIFGINFTL